MRIPPRAVHLTMLGFLWVVTLSAVATLAGIVGWVLWRGLPSVTPRFLFSMPEAAGAEGGIASVILGTLFIIISAVLVATPLGVGTAIYLVEYTRESWVTRVIRYGSDCLAGIPSIIFGLFGYVFFVLFLGFRWSILSGALTLALMSLPTIIRTSEVALRSVPQSFREVSYALGATRWQMVLRVVIPGALPGIVTGIVLALGRSMSETAAVIFTAGTVLPDRVPSSPGDSVRTLAVHFYILATEGATDAQPRAFGTAAILVLAILVINVSAYTLMHRFLARYR
ncbi:MAG: phosphate ABC transporter permease PstA [Candidatus Brocadiae bacterium]|nr:phosphate ABC transporter permease PstA [Candidatus Brocadiia bacterium]